MEDAKIGIELTVELDVWWVHLLLEASEVHLPLTEERIFLGDYILKKKKKKTLPNLDIELELLRSNLLFLVFCF